MYARMDVTSYLSWLIYAVVVGMLSMFVIGASSFLFYRSEISLLSQKVKAFKKEWNNWVCIVTVYNSENCGSFWQAYALGKYIEMMGH